VRSLMAAIPAAPSPEAFQALGAAAQALKDGLARARAFRALTSDPADEGAGPAARLGDLLAGRGLGLSLTGDTHDPSTSRALWALGLAAADLAAPGATVTIAIAQTADGVAMTARVPRGPATGSETPGLSIARRVIEGLAGSLQIADATAGSETTLTAHLPPAAAGAADLPALSA
jgi:hypothetical protein